jgi:hypothetical protein
MQHLLDYIAELESRAETLERLHSAASVRGDSASAISHGARTVEVLSILQRLRMIVRMMEEDACPPELGSGADCI